ncbi:MAG: hypothetical protein MUC52_00690 [Candidatus Omnitrophica bacterium]|nr:hypothetical protein [Candidatus Omnitrophota bacterium]
MIKKTLISLFFFAVSAGCAFGQIGRSVDEFKKSKFAVQEGFKFHDSYLITEDPLYQGKYAFNFFTADKRYKLQIIADRLGKAIVFEYLFYPVADNEMIALKDGSITLDFVSQSSGGKVSADQYISLVCEANAGNRNVKYTRKIEDFIVALTRYDNKMISGWSIGVNK